MLSNPKVLLLSSDEAEARRWEELFREHAALSRARSLAELRRHLERESFDALFCGWSFHAGTWNDALGVVREECPDLPMIVFSGIAGEEEWVHVLEAGAFDLLVAPYQRQTLLPILEQAVASREGRRFHHTGSDRTAAVVSAAG